MNYSSNVYYEYMAKAKKAEEVKQALVELYGPGKTWKYIYCHAVLDKMLSEEEKSLMREFYPIGDNI